APLVCLSARMPRWQRVHRYRGRCGPALCAARRRHRGTLHARTSARPTARELSLRRSREREPRRVCDQATQPHAQACAMRGAGTTARPTGEQRSGV
ncbi:MAG: COG2827: putative endonuclease containing a URI domain, partial [uncultured Lysobacter sp.]